jgi:hypothetical protein
MHLLSILGQKNNFLAIAESLSFIAFLSLSTVKLYEIFLRKRKERAMVMERVKGYLRDSETKIDEEEIQQFLRKFTISWRVIITGYMLATTVYLLKPLTLMLIDWTMLGVKHYRLILPSWYPFETSRGVAWIVAFLVQTWSAFAVLLFVIGSDTMFSAFILILCLKFQALKEKIRKAETYEDLKRCIVVHVDLIETCDMVNSIFEPIIFFNLFITSLTICLEGFLMMVRISVIGQVVAKFY